MDGDLAIVEFSVGIDVLDLERMGHFAENFHEKRYFEALDRKHCYV